jgi:hypothetical protein
VLEVTAAQVADVAARRLAPDKRTVGWFRPLEHQSVTHATSGLSPVRHVLSNGAW